MAQYFPGTRPQARVITDLVTQNPKEKEKAVDSIYIFPNPSSIPPSPSISSEFSVPTNASLSAISRSRANSSLRSWSSGRGSEDARSPLDNIEVEVWDWTLDTESDVSAMELDEAMSQAKRRGCLSIKQTYETPLSSLRPFPLFRTRRFSERPGQGHHRPRAGSVTNVATPHPRINIPLLSFITSFLSVDDSTIHLLTHSPSHSVLFPGHLISLDHIPVEEAEEQPHGSLKLFIDTEDCRLKEGLSVSCDPTDIQTNPLIPSGFPLKGLWSLVSGAWVNGRKGWKEVWGN